MQILIIYHGLTEMISFIFFISEFSIGERKYNYYKIDTQISCAKWLWRRNFCCLRLHLLSYWVQRIVNDRRNAVRNTATIWTTNVRNRLILVQKLRTKSSRGPKLVANTSCQVRKLNWILENIVARKFWISDCNPVKIWMLNRHGTRLPSASQLERLKSLEFVS